MKKPTDDRTIGRSEAPQGFAREVPDAPVSTRVKKLVGEDAAEYERLLKRVLAEPTSERAKQELASFRLLHGIS